VALRRRLRLGPLLYGLLFAVVLPALLVAWARAAAPLVGLPAIHAPRAGALVAASGLVLVAAAMRDLWRLGGGLPMNAYPPPRLVVGGAYAVVGHPIYVGFTLAVAGCAVATGSAAGLWLVSPAVALGSAALVLGHERPDLLRRFGRLPRPWIGVPPADPGMPSWRERTGALLLALVPWVLLYEGIAALGPPPDAVSSLLPLESSWPVFPWAEPVYASTYPVVAAAFLWPSSRSALRTLVLRVLGSMVLVFPLFLVVPLVAPPRSPVPAGVLGDLVLLERSLDTPACAFPSFHVVLAFLAADALPRRGQPSWPWRAWAWGVAASCVLVGAHSILDVAGGLAVVALLRRGGEAWELLRRAAEVVANSWRDWRVGPFRFIVHGLYAGLAAASGVLLIGTALGPGSAGLAAAIWLPGLLGAAAWAQAVEGRGLSRPFGFYGGLLGGIAGVLAAPAFGFGRMEALAAGALAAPVVQALGRIRCLVQGCCHGAPCPAWLGIRHATPLSRVAKAGLGGVPVHPTALYSILWNVAVGGLLLRLAALHAPSNLVAGAYFLLAGAGRFVEEAYRGEPQTPLVLGLRLYQWMAAGSAVAGAVLAALPPYPALRAGPPDPTLLAAAAVAFAVTGAAMGVDVPASSRRLSRLA
jgi:protein-S-isoprenylcysteine O-methyltransferase Ste14